MKDRWKMIYFEKEFVADVIKEIFRKAVVNEELVKEIEEDYL